MLNHRSFFLVEIVGVVFWQINAELLVVLDNTWLRLAGREPVTLSLREKFAVKIQLEYKFLDFTLSMALLMQGMGYNIRPERVMKTPIRMNP